MPSTLDTNFDAVRALIEPTGAFGPISVGSGMLVARAKASAEPASYRLEVESAEGSGAAPILWVVLVTPSRWLSESIESDLVEHGDDVGELVEDELIDLGYDGPGLPPTFQHFRSNDLLYTFRTPVPVAFKAGAPARLDGSAAGVAALWMRAYEQAFRRLGDMEVKPEE